MESRRSLSSISDISTKLNQLDLGQSTEHFKKTLEHFLTVSEENSKSSQLDLPFLDLLNSINRLVKTYAREEGSAESNLHKFVNSLEEIIDYIEDTYQRSARPKGFFSILEIGGEASNSFATYKIYLLGLYERTKNESQAPAPQHLRGNVIPLFPEHKVRTQTLHGIPAVHTEDEPTFPQIPPASLPPRDLFASIANDQPSLTAQDTAQQPVQPEPFTEDYDDRTNPNMNIAMIASVRQPSIPSSTPLSAPRSANPVSTTVLPVAVSTVDSSETSLFVNDQTPISPLRVEDITPVSKASTPKVAVMPAVVPPLIQSEKLPSNPPVQPQLKEKTNNAVEPTPAQHTSRTRKLIYGLLGGLGLGLTALAGYSINSANSAKSSEAPALAAVTSASAKASAAPAESSSAKTAENSASEKIDKTVYQTGILRINTKHENFKKYIQDFGQATGMKTFATDFALQTTVIFEENPAKLKAIQESKKIALNGKESELDQRLAMAEQFLENATTKNIGNSFVTNYFKTLKEGLARFKANGKWSQIDIDRRVDRFFDAIQLPVRYAAPANVITYAPDIDIEQNVPLKNLKNGAPTYEKYFEVAGKQMQEERNPAKVVAVKSQEQVRDAFCKRMKEEIIPTIHDKVTRDGVSYVNKSMCAPEASDNLLHKALRQVIEVTQEPVNSNPKETTPGGIRLNRVQLSTTTQQPSNNLKSIPQPTKASPEFGFSMPTAKPTVQLAEAPNAKPGFFSQAFSKIKSFFGPSEAEKTAAKAAQLAENDFTKVAQPVKADLPTYTWKEQLKNYFLG